MPYDHGEPIYHSEPHTPNMMYDVVSWEFDNNTGDVVIRCETMHMLRFFDEHQLGGLSKEDLLKLYHSPLSTIEDVRKYKTDKIVEKFNQFVRYRVDNQLFDYDTPFDYETE